MCTAVFCLSDNLSICQGSLSVCKGKPVINSVCLRAFAGLSSRKFMVTFFIKGTRKLVITQATVSCLCVTSPTWEAWRYSLGANVDTVHVCHSAEIGSQ